MIALIWNKQNWLRAEVFVRSWWKNKKPHRHMRRKWTRFHARDFYGDWILFLLFYNKTGTGFLTYILSAVFFVYVSRRRANTHIRTHGCVWSGPAKCIVFSFNIFFALILFLSHSIHIRFFPQSNCNLIILILSLICLSFFLLHLFYW